MKNIFLIVTLALGLVGCKAQPAKVDNHEDTEIDTLSKVRELILPSAKAAGVPVADVVEAVHNLGTSQNIGGARKANTCKVVCADSATLTALACNLGDGSSAWESVWFNPDTTNAAILYGAGGSGDLYDGDAGTGSDQGAPFGGTGDPDGIAWPGSAGLHSCRGDGADVTTYLVVYGR